MQVRQIEPRRVPAGRARPDRIHCSMCRHRVGVGFHGLAEEEAEFMAEFKLGRGVAPRGSYLERVTPGRMLFTLYSGWALLLYRDAERGVDVPLNLALPGQLVGLETLTTPFPLVARALTDVTYCRFDPSRWQELLAVPSIAERLCRIQIDAQRDLELRQLANTSLPATGRLCNLLFVLYEGLRQRRLLRGHAFQLPLARNDLAALLGLTPIHLRRVIAGLEAAGVIAMDRQRVTLLDLPELRRLAGDPPLPAFPRSLL